MQRFILLVVFCVSGLGACSRTERERAFEPATDADTVARVNGVPITRTELDMWVSRGRHGGEAGDELRAKALEALIARELVRQEAYRQGLDREQTTAKKLAALRAQYLAAQRDELGAAFNARELAAGEAVGEAEARAYFDRHAEAMRTEYHIQQIAYTKDPAAIAEAKRALDEGTPFATVAARRFPGLPADQRPWDLGYLRFGQLPPEWREVVAKLEPGQTSDVLKGAGERWWLINLVEKRVNDAVTFETERQVIATLLQTENQERSRATRLEALRKGADITYVKP